MWNVGIFIPQPSRWPAQGVSSLMGEVVGPLSYSKKGNTARNVAAGCCSEQGSGRLDVYTGNTEICILFCWVGEGQRWDGQQLPARGSQEHTLVKVVFVTCHTKGEHIWQTSVGGRG